MTVYALDTGEQLMKKRRQDRYDVRDRSVPQYDENLVTRLAPASAREIADLNDGLTVHRSPEVKPKVDLSLLTEQDDSRDLLLPDDCFTWGLQ